MKNRAKEQQPADINCETDADEYQSRLPRARKPRLEFVLWDCELGPGTGINAYTFLGAVLGFGD